MAVSSLGHLFFLCTYILITITTVAHSQCLDHQKTLLLELKSELVFNSSASLKLVRWNQEDDCCEWNGVECDGAGRVISLQLDGESISGGLNESSSSSLFRLRYLQRLNLAYNLMNGTQIPRGIRRLTHLTNLNLSYSGYGGDVPLELSFLRRLDVLDLSLHWQVQSLKLEHPNLEMVIRNLTRLRELYLDGVHISAAGSEWCQPISSSLPYLKILSLRDCDLSGPFDPSLLQLHSLSVLHLDLNVFSATIPDFFANFSSLTTFSCSDCSLGPFPKKIFQVPTLQELDLSGNRRFGGTITHFFPNITTLRSLNLADCAFVGPIPSTLWNLTELIDLDLSDNSLTGLVPSFHMSNKLKTIRLYWNSLTGSLTNSHFEGLSDLTSLELQENSLSGSVPSVLLGLPSLQTLDLSNNQFSGQINGMFPINTSTSIVSLDLSYNSLSGSIPHSFFGLPSLETLQLSFNQFSGQINEFPLNISSIVSLDLSRNSLSGSVPQSLNISSIVSLDLSHNSLSGSIPQSLFGMPSSLESLFLAQNSLSGSIPRSLFGLPSLVSLDLSNNRFSGQINGFPINISGVVSLYMGGNSLSGSIPHSLFSLPSLKTLELSQNQFSGQINGFPINMSSIVALYLSDNSLSGSIPISLFGLPSLESLDLSNNQFSGQINEFSDANVSVMVSLDLSGNQLEGPIPDSVFQLGLPFLFLHDNFFNGQLPNLPYNLSDEARGLHLLQLDLSNNRIVGDIPSWVWEHPLEHLNLSYNLFEDLQKPYHFSLLESLDLHSNKLHGELPQLPQSANHVDFSSNYFHTIPPNFFENVTCPIIYFLSLANNGLSGAIPTSFCNGTGKFVQVLDLSFNNLTSITPCAVENIESLVILKLRGNNINGVIPDQFSASCNLADLDLSHNNFGGKIPKSLANCSLAVLNAGYNSFDDSFPCMLPQSLNILVLRSNKFHGEWRCNKSWPTLQILDLSSNHFNGSLHQLKYSNWSGMVLQSDGHLRPNRSVSDFLGGDNFYLYEVTLTVKGVEVNLVKIWPDFTSIDLSCNNFQGSIPDEVGNLTSLYLLNLSHNALTASIPKSLGALTELGSLDLSFNQLRGRIPEELAGLTFLSILNVSYNELVGMIPKGPQFNTFSANSFQGNTDLCGFPLNRSCSNSTDGNGSTAPAKEKDEDEEEIKWEYGCAVAGYVVGLGSIAWILLFWRRFRERYFDKIEDVVEDIFYRRDGRRRRRRRRTSVRRH